MKVTHTCKLPIQEKMKQRILPFLLVFTVSIFLSISVRAQNSQMKTEETIFVFGGDINQKFVQYVVDLTGKKNPKVCYLPTASADNQDNIQYWENISDRIGIEPIVLKVWVSSSEENKSFEDILLNSDAIVVGGGNTLNMLGIWKAQGIDTLLNKALKKGIILAGGSAGSICWFQKGVSDSRPVHLSSVNGLGFLPYSNCPHYSQEAKKNLYHQMIQDQQMTSGYAIDELAGILFKNEKAVEFVSQSNMQNSYFVHTEKGKVISTKMESEILVDKNAIPKNSYTSVPVKQKIKDLQEINDQTQPLNAYVSEIKNLRLNKDGISEAEKNKVLNIGIEKIFIYENKIAGVTNDAYLDSFGYGVWYFYNCDGAWKSMGEDIGGKTVSDSEVTFREKAKIIIEQAQKKFNCQ